MASSSSTTSTSIQPGLIVSELQSLVDNGLFHSCQLLTSLILSDKETDNSLMEFELRLCLSDSLKEQKSYIRAATSYELSLQLFKNSKVSKTKPQLQYDIWVKIAECYLGAKRPKLALFALDKIPQHLKSSKINLMQAKIHQDLGEKTSAINSYYEVLREQPFAIEVYLELMKLGIEFDQLMLKYGERITKFVPWLLSFLKAHQQIARLEYTTAITELMNLEKRFVENIQLFLSIAHCYFKLGNMIDSSRYYSKIRKIDKHTIDQMDQYASVIKVEGKVLEMSRLVEDLIDIDETRPEPWLSMAKYCEMKGDNEKALVFVNKAIKLKPTHANSFLLKGALLLSVNSTESIQAFQEAFTLNPDLDSLHGLLEVYISQSKIHEALTLAKETITKYPRNPKALTLLGAVLSQHSGPKDKAKKAFETALSIEPNCLDALVTCVTVLVSERNFQTAINLLERYTSKHTSEFAHTRLGDVYTLNSDYSKAMENYNISLGLNPDSQRALEGIKRLEKLISGVQDEKNDEDEDEEDEDDEGMNVY